MTQTITSIIDQISELTLEEVGSLKSALENKFGVKAIQQNNFQPNKTEEISQVEEQSEFEIVLTSGGNTKINVIKVLRELFSFSLKEAKDIVDTVPKTLKESASKAEAETIQKKITEAGGIVEIK